MAKEKKYLAFYPSFFNSGERFPDEDRLLFYDSILRCAFQGVYPDLDNMPLHVAAALDNALPNVEAFRVKQQNGIESGGRPQKDETDSKKGTFSESKKQPFSKSKSEKEKEKEREIEKERETKKPRAKKQKSVEESRQGKNAYSDEVYLTEKQYDSLVERFGEVGAAWCIDRLDAYKASAGKTYLDDYAAMRSWVFGEYEAYREKHPAAVSRIEKTQTADEVEAIKKNMFD